jgi:hypothetical protein
MLADILYRQADKFFKDEPKNQTSDNFFPQFDVAFSNAFYTPAGL